MTTRVSLPVQNTIVTVQTNCDLKVKKEVKKK